MRVRTEFLHSTARMTVDFQDNPPMTFPGIDATCKQ